MCSGVRHHIGHGDSTILRNEISADALIVGHSKHSRPPIGIHSLLKGLKKQTDVTGFSIERVMKFFRGGLVQLQPFT
jgi:hypothetical protein